jgi:hypothetical protein
MTSRRGCRVEAPPPAVCAIRITSRNELWDDEKKNQLARLYYRYVKHCPDLPSDNTTSVSRRSLSPTFCLSYSHHVCRACGCRHVTKEQKLQHCRLHTIRSYCDVNDVQSCGRGGLNDGEWAGLGVVEFEGAALGVFWESRRGLLNDVFGSSVSV